MIQSTLADAAKCMRGSLRGKDAQFRGVSTDTRFLRPGELFVALQGPNFDGAAFVEQAADSQAAGAVVSRKMNVNFSTIVVDDTVKALGELGKNWRKQLSATVLGVTGSNGKTTLKELLASCLSISADTFATHGNLNNEIGVPLMLLRLASNHRFAVIEMGANRSGEIAYLTSLALPDLVTITNAAPAHLEGFGSVEGVAHSKGEIITGKRTPQFVILNADDDYFDYWKSITNGSRVVSFGLGLNADIRASDIKTYEEHAEFNLHLTDECYEVRLPLAGKHNVLNACATAAIASSLGISGKQIQRGLETVRPISGRLQTVQSHIGATLYDDSYNANPVSVQAAAEFLAAQKGECWFVLGDMGELGEDAELLHAHTGCLIKEAGIENLFATGPLSRKAVDSFGEGGRWFESVEALSKELKVLVTKDDAVLVKGSRCMGMERVVKALAITEDIAIQDSMRSA